MGSHFQQQVSVGAAIEGQDFAQEQQGLLDLIDKLQFAQLDNVKLPQIVVVGDQSAGKSSVLEAISQTPFPREAGACTRFATEIRLRRAKKEKFSVHIIPDKSRPFAEQERLSKFGGMVDESTPFDILMTRAVEQIAPKKIPGRFATKDILVVEKLGPNMPLLTLVDLPGLVQNPNNDQSKDDIKAINDLTDHYMKSSRTIILAVVGGNGDYVQAPVLIKAREFDPTGGRTIGVLTKPDLTESIGLEDKFIALVNNQDKHNDFKLGWYVLLNPGPREPGQPWPTAEERKQHEDAFFKRGKWASLSPSMCGVAALKQKLSLQLQRHIGKHLKTLRREINKALEDCESELKSLGTGKDTVEEMREELVQLCSDSKDLVNPAVDGTYKNPAGRSFFPRGVNQESTPAQNLRARAVEENKRFASRVRTLGHKLNFATGLDTINPVRRGGLTKEEFARKEVERLIQQHTGTEFPSDHNPRLVYRLFQSYSENWSRLAQEHKDNLGIICNEFLAEVIDDVWPQRMREPLRNVFLDPQIREMLDRAQKEVDKLAKDQDFEVQPYDPEYETRLAQWRATATVERPHTVAEEVLEKMLIHYELSAKIFITNVITQVVERHLLQGLYEVFGSVKVWRMKNEHVEAIAAENKATRDKRLVLKGRKKAIEEARDICASLAMRKELRAYGDDELDESDDGSGDEAESWNTPKKSRGSVRESTRAQVQTNDASYRKPPPMTNGKSARAHSPSPSVASTKIEESTSRPYSENTARNEPPRTPGGWNEQTPSEYYKPNVAPQYVPPPPPPRPEKRPTEDFTVTPPDSGTRRSFPEQAYGVDTTRRYDGTYPKVEARENGVHFQQSPATQRTNYEDSYAQDQSKQRSRRGIFGSKG